MAYPLHALFFRWVKRLADDVLAEPCCREFYWAGCKLGFASCEYE
jgi:hypothetical protein